GTVVAPGEDGLAVGAEGGVSSGPIMGKDGLESSVMRLPRCQVGSGGVLPIAIIGRGRGPPALDHPEQARTDLVLLKSSLTAIVVADRQQAVRSGQRCPEVARQGVDLLCVLRLLDAEPALAVGVQDREYGHGHQ